MGGQSTVYWLNEVNEEYYELTFGDGYFGKKLRDGAKIFVTYVVTQGALGNGITALNNFTYTGRMVTSNGEAVRANATITSARLQKVELRLKV